MKSLSSVTEKFNESVIREMTRVCLEHDGFNLSQGLPDLETPEQIAVAAVRAIEAGRNQYPITFGEPELREAIAAKARRFNGMDVDPATDVTVTCGAGEAMMSTLRALLDPGDEVVVFEPFYENYVPGTLLAGAVPRFVKLEPPGWVLDLEEMRAAFSKKTKAVIVNTPMNPCGKVFTRADLEAVSRACLEFDTYAVTDEIYEHMTYDGTEHVSLATLPGMADRTVTINSISKTYCATGWRVGWAIARERITARIRKVHDYLTVGAPTPFQHAAVAALNLPESYYTDLCRMYRERRDMILEVLEKAGFRPHVPKGAYYLMADISKLVEKIGGKDDTAFAHRLVERTGVAGVPGSSFYHRPEDGAALIRFSFCKTWETLHAVEKALTKT